VSALLAALLLATAAPGADEPLPTLAGGTYSVEAVVARGPVVLVFWNSWLPGADAFATLIPEVERAATASGRTGVVVLFQDDATAAAAVARRTPSLTWVVDRHGQLLRRFQITRAPSVVAVDRGGDVRQRAGPAATEVRALLASLGEQ
jgi:thioredoxin-like negative regulator of GroEL